MNWKEKVIELMTTKNITQKDLPWLDGITETSISRYLNGSQRPRIDVLLNFAKALEVNVEYLLEERSSQESSFTAIATVIAKNGSNLTLEEQNKLIALILGKGKSSGN